MNQIMKFLEKQIGVMETVFSLYEEGRKATFEIELAHLKRMLEIELKAEEQSLLEPEEELEETNFEPIGDEPPKKTIEEIAAAEEAFFKQNLGV